MSSVASAQPKITSISRDWIPRGTEVEVTISGDGLNSVTGLVFSGESGLSATLVREKVKAPLPSVTIEATSKAISVAPPGSPDRSKRLRAKITATADAPLGAREVRALGPTGISAPLTVTVGHLPEVTETEPNNTPEQAQMISLPTTVNGAVSAATEVDCFRFKAKKGDALVFEVLASRNGSQLDSSLAILDAQGKELARDEDARGFDSLLEFTAPEDGEYVAQLRDFQYRGGGNYSYRLFAGVLPYVDSIFPFGGQRGKPVEVSVSGRNLQGAEKMTLNIDPASPLGRQEIRLNTPQGFSNPIAFDVQNISEFIESEPNSGTNANSITLPVIINGRIGEPKDNDRFKFKVDADQKIVCVVAARGFGSPLDALLSVSANDSVISQNDDADGTDARLEFDAKKDTEYVVALRDLTGRGGDNFTYRLTVRPSKAAAPTFVAKFYPDAIRLYRSGRTRVRCEIVRQGGFDGAVRVLAENLPDGVTAEPLIIAPGRNEGDLLITASTEAAMGTIPLKLSALATIAGKQVTQIASAIAPNPPPNDKTEKTFKQGFLCVFDTAPFTVDALTPAVAMDQEQSGTIDVVVQRRAGFNEDIKLSAVGFTMGRELITKSFDAKDVIVKSNDVAKLTLRAKIDSEIGTRTILVRGEATNNGQSVVQFSQPVAVTVAQIPFVLSAAPAKVSLNAPRSGATSEVDEVSIKIKVDRRGFTGEVPLVLDGLPAGVTVDGTNVAANAAEGTLKFIASDKVVPGTNYSVTVKGTITHNDRIYRRSTGAIKLTISPPAALEVAATNAVIAPK